MEPITIALGAAYVAEKITEDLFHESILKKGRQFLFPKPTYKSLFEKTLTEAINEFEQTVRKATPGYYFFYNYKDLFALIVENYVYEKNNIDEIKDLAEKIPKLIRPTEEDINKFFEILGKKIQRDEKLKGLYINENYKRKVFEVDEKVDVIQDLLKNLKTGWHI
jgi:hypothetical protein